MPVSRFISNNLRPSSRLLIPAAIGLAVLAITVGQPALAGDCIDCQPHSGDPDTPPPTSTPLPESSPPSQTELRDRDDDRRYWAIQQCCTRLVEGRPLRGAFCSNRELKQSFKECRPALSDRVIRSLQAPGSQAPLASKVPQKKSTPTPARIPIISQILDLIGI